MSQSFNRLAGLFAVIAAAAPVLVAAEDLSLCKSGWNATQSGDHSTAVKLFKSCIKDGQLSTASLARTYRNIGIAYRRAKESENAVEAFNKAIELKPSDVWDDYINRGNAHDDDGEFEAALADYDSALKLYPGYGEAYYNRGIAFEGRKQFDKAKAEFVSAYEHGLRTELLYDRLVTYGLIKKR